MALPTLAEPALQIDLPRQVYFSDAAVRFGVTPEGADSAILIASLTAKQRTLASLEVQAPSEQSLDLTLEPKLDLRPAVMLPAELTVTLLSADDRRVLARESLQVHLFARDLWKENPRWLRGLEVGVIGAEGKLAQFLEHEGIPFERLSSNFAVPEPPGRVILVDQPVNAGLLDALRDSANQGSLVYVRLAAQESLALSRGRESGWNFMDTEAVYELERRLLGISWFGRSGDLVESRFRLGADAAGPTLEVLQPGEDAPGWCWLDIEFTGGQLVFSGLELFPNALSQPTPSPGPRYFFKALLQNWSDRRSQAPRHGGNP